MLDTRRREVLSWALYDFGSSSFNTLMIAFIFNRFFTDVIAPDVNAGTVMWAQAINISAVVVAIISPVLGAVADYSGRKKLFLVFFAMLSIVFTTLLFLAGPTAAAGTVILLFVIANIGFEAANVFYYAFLPDVSDDANIGRVSGKGFFLGYIGGLISLAIGLGMIRGWLPKDDYLNVRATILLVAAWYFVFAMRMFLFVKQKAVPQKIEGGYIRHGFNRLFSTIKHARQYKIGRAHV